MVELGSATTWGFRARSLACTLALAGSVGCGARTAIETDQSAPSSTPPSLTELVDTPVAAEGDPGRPGRGGQMGGFLSGTDPLPPCDLGVPRASASSCRYVYDGRCYETSLDACACACPRDRVDSVCAQGLPDESGAFPIKYCR